MINPTQIIAHRVLGADRLKKVQALGIDKIESDVLVVRRDNSNFLYVGHFKEWRQAGIPESADGIFSGDIGHISAQLEKHNFTPPLPLNEFISLCNKQNVQVFLEVKWYPWCDSKPELVEWYVNNIIDSIGDQNVILSLDRELLCKIRQKDERVQLGILTRDIPQQSEIGSWLQALDPQYILFEVFYSPIRWQEYNDKVKLGAFLINDSQLLKWHANRFAEGLVMSDKPEKLLTA